AAHELETSPTIMYGCALCNYRLRRYSKCMDILTDLIDLSSAQYPQLVALEGSESMHAAHDAVLDLSSVGNSKALASSCLVEAYNLRMAVAWTLKDKETARHALGSMPHRVEEELDPVSLHNKALLEMDTAPGDGFQKLRWLIQSPPFPPETYGNFLLLCLDHGLWGLAADMRADNPHLLSCLSPDTEEYLEAVLLQRTSPEEAYHKLSKLKNRYTSRLEQSSREIERVRESGDEDSLQMAIGKFDQVLGSYVPVVLAQAGILYELGQPKSCEALLRSVQKYLGDQSVWRLDLAHTLFVQENRYEEAILEYEELVKQHRGDILDIPAVALACMCVSHVIEQQNSVAEEILQKVAVSEQERRLSDPTGRVPVHSCVANLVIGNLYCVKGQPESGVPMTLNGVHPVKDMLAPDTWFYAKKAVMSFLVQCAKRLARIDDKLWERIIDFLNEVDVHGRDMPAEIVSETTSSIQGTVNGNARRRTIADEARAIQVLYRRLVGQSGDMARGTSEQVS
ncbi:hypothetical protein KIPB_008924, partial [Kipferlia bialata]